MTYDEEKKVAEIIELMALTISNLKSLIRDCQSDLAKYLPSDSGISEKEIISMLLERLDGPQAREALNG